MTELSTASLSQNPLLARAALRHHLRVPDGSALIDDEGRAAAPLEVALALMAALGGGLCFGAVIALGGGVGVGADGGALVRLAPALLAGAGIAGVLTLPPLYLVTALRGRSSTAAQMLASASIGPAVFGLWLGAAAPLLLLFSLAADAAFARSLLGLSLAAAGLAAGGIAVVRRSRRLGAGGPGVLVLLGHYLLTAWTALVLASHLA